MPSIFFGNDQSLKLVLQKKSQLFYLCLNIAHEVSLLVLHMQFVCLWRLGGCCGSYFEEEYELSLLSDEA